MLDELAVHNLGIIDHAQLEPSPGFTVVTGETGTGKTLLLGALRLLVGGTARGDVIGPHDDEARVEGRFIVGEDEIAVARRVGGGRSRAYLDGSMATATAVESRLGAAVEIVGQHDHLMLTTTGELRRLLDRFVLPDVINRYRHAWDELDFLRARLEALGGDRRALERELDLVSYQVEEIEAASLDPEEEAALAAAISRLRHSEELQERLAAVRAHFAAASSGLGDAVGDLRRARQLDPELEHLLEAVEGCAVQVGELESDTRARFEALQSDPAALEELEHRFAQLADLRRKYGASIEEVLGFAERTAKRRDELADLLGSADELERSHAAAVSRVTAAGAELRVARATAGSRVAEAATGHLRELGFDDPLVQFSVEEAVPGPTGAERVLLLFASDQRLEPGPVGRVASGGELSRLVLSLRLAAGAGDAAVVAFDEVDAGVGGSTALELGRKLAALAQSRQVLCVTHLPQVAAFADLHVVVERDGASAAVRVVEGEQRLEELARMLSGLPDSEAGRVHAEELRRLASENAR